MGSRVDDVIRLCCELTADCKMKAAVKGSAQGGAVAGGAAFVGGLVGGPAGIAVGAALGGALGWWMTSGQFKPLPEIIMELPPVHKEKLSSDIMEILGNLNWTDVLQLITHVRANNRIQEKVLSAVASYATKELGAKVEYGD